ncbi:hypothetical protein V8F06_001712 [Rhypophila decipiens]
MPLLRSISGYMSHWRFAEFGVCLLFGLVWKGNGCCFLGGMVALSGILTRRILIVGGRVLLSRQTCLLQRYYLAAFSFVRLLSLYFSFYFFIFLIRQRGQRWSFLAFIWGVDWRKISDFFSGWTG